MNTDRFVSVVTDISVEWLLKNVDYSVDGYNYCPHCKEDTFYCGCVTDTVLNWEAMIEAKFYDCSEHFMNDIMSEGIRNPICLRWDEESGRWTHGNGHHRTTMAILLCMDSIPAVFSFDRYEYMMEWVTT